MALKLFQVEGGLSDGNIHYLSGAGVPNGGYADAAPVGSQYHDSSTQTAYKKITSGAGADKWALAIASEKLFQRVSQTAHGFTGGELVRINSSGDYVKALGDIGSNADVVGIVESILDANGFVLVTEGYSNVASAEAEGAPLFLSISVPGGISATKPSSGVQKHIGYVKNGRVLLHIGPSIELASTEAPFVPLFVTTNVLALQSVAAVSTSEVGSVLWEVNVSTTTGRYQTLVYAGHDALDGADAAESDHSEIGIMEFGAAVAGLAIGTSLTGSGSAQELNLVVAANPAATVRVRQISA